MWTTEVQPSHVWRTQDMIRALPLLLLLSRFSRVQFCATSQMAAHQAPPSLGFSRQEHCSGLPIPSPMHESEVAQSCPTLSDPMDCSLPGSSVHGILQARVLEWVAIAFSRYELSAHIFSQREERTKRQKRMMWSPYGPFETQQDPVGLLSMKAFLCPLFLVCRKLASASMTCPEYQRRGSNCH